MKEMKEQAVWLSGGKNIPETGNKERSIVLSEKLQGRHDWNRRGKGQGGRREKEKWGQVTVNLDEMKGHERILSRAMTWSDAHSGKTSQELIVITQRKMVTQTKEQGCGKKWMHSEGILKEASREFADGLEEDDSWASDPIP